MMPIDPLVRTVLNLMTRFGGDSILKVPTTGSYDPATSKATKVVGEYPVRTMSFDYIPKHAGMTVDANSLIRAGDKQVFMKPDPDVPAPLAKIHELHLNGIKHTIITVKDHNPSGVKSYLYEMYVRA